jgi:Dyp-type peroxidase family
MPAGGAARPDSGEADTAADLPLRSSEDIQGNILPGFNKDHQAFLLVGFGDAETGQGSGRTWLQRIVDSITSSAEVVRFTDELKRRRREEGRHPADMKQRWVNLSLTCPGLLTLAPATKLNGYPAFRVGAATRARRVGDTGRSRPKRWVFGTDPQGIHALLTLAADDPDDLREAVSSHRSLAEDCGVRVVRDLCGQTLPQRSREHFGFGDAVSQPGVRGFDPAVYCNVHERDEDAEHPGSLIIAAGEFLLGRQREQPCTEPRVQGRPDRPDPPPEWTHDGSFQVFRRLAQDVQGWWAQIARNSVVVTQESVPVDPQLLAAKAVGRWRGGVPVALAPQPDTAADVAATDYNHFTYDDDPVGAKTPRFAHIRKMNPRNRRFCDTSHRILRRGIPYGPPLDLDNPQADAVTAERGLLFNAFMADLEDQFEFLQERWANNSSFPSFIHDLLRWTDNGPDPVLGAPQEGALCLLRQPGKDVELDFGRFVHTTGAVYAFAPSIGTLRRLAAGEPL